MAESLFIKERFIRPKRTSRESMSAIRQLMGLFYASRRVEERYKLF